jgi:hypothetical protein
MALGAIHARATAEDGELPCGERMRRILTERDVEELLRADVGILYKHSPT